MLLLLASAGLRAQPLDLTLEKALEIALSENPTIRIADKEIERQKYVRRETVGNHLPNLSASGSYNRSIIKSTIDAGNGQKFSFEPDNTVTGALSLSIPLFAPTIYSTLKLNDEQMRAAVEAARANRVTLVSEVKKAYYNILLAEQSLSVLLASEANITQTVDQTRALYEQELASEYDLLTSQVQLSNLQPTIIQTRNSIRIAQQLLKMYLSLPQEVEIAVSGTLDDFQNRVLAASTLSTDYSNNTDLRSLEIQESILNQQFKVARTQRMPTLSALSNFQVMGRDKISLSFGGAGEETASKKFETMTPLSAGLQLSVPIFAGLTKVNRERQIRNNIEQLRLQREYLEQSVDVQVRTSLNNLMTAKAQMDANTKTIAQARKGYDIAQTRYFNGVGTMLELNTAELSLTQARLNYSQSIYDYLAAEAEYRKILGEEL